jgi:hypothetical protein
VDPDLFFLLKQMRTVLFYWIFSGLSIPSVVPPHTIIPYWHLDWYSDIYTILIVSLGINLFKLYNLNVIVLNRVVMFNTRICHLISWSNIKPKYFILVNLFIVEYLGLSLLS